MDFKECLACVKSMLSAEFKGMDFEGDLGVANKVEQLCWAITNRLNNPAPIKPEPKPQSNVGSDLDTEWRRM